VEKSGSVDERFSQSGVVAGGSARAGGGLTGGSSDLNCANLECSAPFSFRRGRLFRFYHRPPKGNAASMNQHSLKHLWLCKQCTEMYTLEYQEGKRLLVPLAAPRPLLVTRYADASLPREETSLQQAVKFPKRSPRRLERHTGG
jgi:hypothetical protein